MFWSEKWGSGQYLIGIISGSAPGDQKGEKLNYFSKISEPTTIEFLNKYLYLK